MADWGSDYRKKNMSKTIQNWQETERERESELKKIIKSTRRTEQQRGRRDKHILVAFIRSK